MMNWKQQKVLVTGAGGFIGSHLTEQLVTMGASTRAFIRYNSANSWGWLDHSPHKDAVEVVLGDTRDRDSVRRAVEGVDVIFHLAALITIPYSYEAPLSYVQTNIEGSMNVFQAALEADVQRVIHTSTSEVYGTAQYVPIDEGHPLQGQSPYAASKIGADKMAEAFHLSFGLPVVTVRPFNTYGPRQSARAVIPTIITQALTQDAVTLGNLTPTRDLTFVADTVAGFIAAAEHSAALGKVINLGSEQEISIGDLARTILQLVGKPDLPVLSHEQRIRPSGSEVDRLLAAAAKAHTLLDWHPTYTLETGLTQTIAWIKEHMAFFRPKQYTI